MEEVKLSAKAKRQEAALDKTNERLLIEGKRLDARAKVLEELIRREKLLIHREEEFRAAINAERQAIDTEYRKLDEMSLAN